ncbi:MAG: hypothetical protein VW378_04990 [bacterium]
MSKSAILNVKNLGFVPYLFIASFCLLLMSIPLSAADDEVEKGRRGDNLEQPRYSESPNNSGNRTPWWKKPFTDNRVKPLIDTPDTDLSERPVDPRDMQDWKKKDTELKDQRRNEAIARGISLDQSTKIRTYIHLQTLAEDTEKNPNASEERKSFAKQFRKDEARLRKDDPTLSAKIDTLRLEMNQDPDQKDAVLEMVNAMDRYDEKTLRLADEFRQNPDALKAAQSMIKDLGSRYEDTKKVQRLLSEMNLSPEKEREARRFMDDLTRSPEAAERAKELSREMTQEPKMAKEITDMLRDMERHPEIAAEARNLVREMKAYPEGAQELQRMIKDIQHNPELRDAQADILHDPDLKDKGRPARSPDQTPAQDPRQEFAFDTLPPHVLDETKQVLNLAPGQDLDFDNQDVREAVQEAYLRLNEPLPQGFSPNKLPKSGVR